MSFVYENFYCKSTERFITDRGTPLSKIHLWRGWEELREEDKAIKRHDYVHLNIGAYQGIVFFQPVYFFDITITCVHLKFSLLNEAGDCQAETG